ncbi:MAG: hypothetical protein JJU45_15580 [Acidimicrobiia bacterium]|nr:hypothetical protein [Acidimicrobiia bacterium]
MATRQAPLNLDAWTKEPQQTDETQGPDAAATGWTRWNNMSPEVEFCETAAQLVRMARPHTILETGVGQGYTTRRVAAAMPPGAVYRCFEAYQPLREALNGLEFFADPSRMLVDADTPTVDDWQWAQFTVLDSGSEHRSNELHGWYEHAPDNALLLVHDANRTHPEWTNHRKIAELILELGIPGVFLPNPRGSFFGQKR